jgi:hypothetical protein
VWPSAGNSRCTRGWQVCHRQVLSRQWGWRLVGRVKWRAIPGPLPVPKYRNESDALFVWPGGLWNWTRSLSTHPSPLLTPPLIMTPCFVPSFYY